MPGLRSRQRQVPGPPPTGRTSSSLVAPRSYSGRAWSRLVRTPPRAAHQTSRTVAANRPIATQRTEREPRLNRCSFSVFWLTISVYAPLTLVPPNSTAALAAGRDRRAAPLLAPSGPRSPATSRSHPSPPRWSRLPAATAAHRDQLALLVADSRPLPSPASWSRSRGCRRHPRRATRAPGRCRRRAPLLAPSGPVASDV